MELQLSYFSIPSLQEIALRKVTVNLWNGSDSLDSIENYCPAPREHYGEYSENWSKTVESKVRDKVWQLKLPHMLKEQVLHIITPIGLQIKKWKGFHELHLGLPGWEEILEKYLPVSFLEFNAYILSKLCWSTAGAVDYRSTAQELVRCEMVDIVKRYQLASLYCLDDYIQITWEELPEEIKRMFCNGGTARTTRPDMQFCGPYILKGKQSKLICRIAHYYKIYPSFHLNAFHSSARIGNKAATEYFFQKLTQYEKDSSVIRSTIQAIVRQFCSKNTFPSENLSDVLIYLLSQMTHEEQVKILKENPVEILLFFMYWPYQDVFLKNAHIFWDFIPEADYSKLMRKMFDLFRKSKTYSANFFQAFFIHSPINFKKLFVNEECVSGYFCSGFSDIQDSETLRVILRNVDATDRLRLVFSKNIFNFFYLCLVGGRTHALLECLREATLSKDDRERLIGAFMEYIRIFRTAFFKDNGDLKYNFLQSIYKIDSSTQSKRCLEDEFLDIAKKFRSDE